MTIVPDAIAQIVGHTAAETYGVVGRPGKEIERAADPRQREATYGAQADADGPVLDLHVVVEYGLNLAEVVAHAPVTASPTRSSG